MGPEVQDSNKKLRKLFRFLRDLGGKRLTLQSFAGHRGRQVVELHVLGEQRGGFVRSDLGDEGKSPNTEQ